jgi:hypothetical protein
MTVCVPSRTMDLPNTIEKRYGFILVQLARPDLSLADTGQFLKGLRLRLAYVDMKYG